MIRKIGNTKWIGKFEQSYLFFNKLNYGFNWKYSPKGLICKNLIQTDESRSE